MFPAALNLLLAALLSLGGSPLGCACGARGCAKPGREQACARMSAPDCCAACLARPARWSEEGRATLPAAPAPAARCAPQAALSAPVVAAGSPPGSPPGLPLRI